jgi:hypothetical protein
LFVCLFVCFVCLFVLFVCLFEFAPVAVHVHKDRPAMLYQIVRLQTASGNIANRYHRTDTLASPRQPAWSPTGWLLMLATPVASFQESFRCTISSWTHTVWYFRKGV